MGRLREKREMPDRKVGRTESTIRRIFVCKHGDLSAVPRTHV